MEFSKEQKRIINSKKTGYRLLKGKTNSGKTFAAINRIPVLLKSYCVEKEDRVLVVSKDNNEKNKLIYMYKNIEKAKYEQRSFFDDDNKDKCEFKSIEEIILFMFKQYKESEKINFILLSETQRLNYISKSINFVKEQTKNYKRFEKKNLFNIDIIKEEIKFIKECNYNDIDEYQNNYTSHNLKLRKNSKDRKIVFEIFKEYNNLLRKNNFIDYEDISIFAYFYSHNAKKYNNIIIDEVQEFTKVQLDILNSLYKENRNSNMIFTLDSDKIEYSKGWINKKRKFKTLGYNMTGKTVNFKSTFKKYSENINSEVIKPKSICEEGKIMEDTCKYIDLNRRVCHEFIKDTSSSNEIYTSFDNYKEKVEDVVSIPVYNEIAAGSPILMNDEYEFSYTLPKDWIRTNKDVFILKIKGDSMVNKNINDGDYVVINKQKYPANSEIVAVEIEGEATLKTFKKKGNTVMLIPENEAYDPIILDKDKECSLLGVAVGIIKNM